MGNIRAKKLKLGWKIVCRVRPSSILFAEYSSDNKNKKNLLMMMELKQIIKNHGKKYYFVAYYYRTIHKTTCGLYIFSINKLYTFLFEPHTKLSKYLSPKPMHRYI